MSHNQKVLLILLLLIPFQIIAQKSQKSFSLFGKITDDSGTPLPAASIYIADIRLGTLSDSSGNYRIQGIPTGNFLVSIDYSGFHSVLKNIKFEADIQMDFRLQTAVTEEKEIVITSALQATSLKRNPIPVISISQNFLSQNLNSNIVSAIAGVPGLSAVTTGPNVAKPFIRGLGYNRILTLFDGIRQEGQQWGDEHGVEIDENTVSRVEVIKGPASLLYGSDALGGVINFLPPRDPAQGVHRGEAAVGYQTNNNLMEITANTEDHVRDFSWTLIGTHKMAADYRNKIDKRVYNTGFRESDLFFQSTLNKKWGYSRIGASYFNDLQEIPEGKRDSTTRRFMKETGDDEFEIVPEKELRSYKISPIHQQIQHLRIYNISNITLGKKRLETKLGFQKNIRREFEDPGLDDASLYLILNTLTYDIKFFLFQIKNLNIISGFNGLYQKNNPFRGKEFLIPEYHQFDFGPFVYARLTRGKTEWAGGIRYDTRRFGNEELYIREEGEKQIPVTGADTSGGDKLFSDYHHTFGGVSGSAGFSHRFNSRWNIKINSARGYRAPNISEISSNGIHAGSKIYQLGNERFKPEFSFQQDANVTFHTQHLTVDASAFLNNISNYIFNQKLVRADGSDSVLVPGFQTFQYTASRARLYGGEFSIDIHPHPLDWLHFENTLSLVFSKNRGIKGQSIAEDEKYLPFIPPVHGRSELRAAFQKWNRLKNPYGKIQLDAFAPQNRVFSLNETETPTPGYHLFNIGMGSEIAGKNGKTIFSIFFTANNVFDVAYQSNMSRLKYFEEFPDDPRDHRGIYEMGRNISIKILVPFSN